MIRACVRLAFATAGNYVASAILIGGKERTATGALEAVIEIAPTSATRGPGKESLEKCRVALSERGAEYSLPRSSTLATKRLQLGRIPVYC